MDFKVTIRRAVPVDITVLTEISFESKKYWQYPSEYFKSWESELIISAPYIKKNIVCAAESEKEIIGYYSLVKVLEPFLIKYNKMPAGLWLEHIFVKPAYIGKGAGSALLLHAEKESMLMGCDFIHVLSDPNATGFYLKAGYDYISDVPSSIENRKTPYLRRAL